MADSDDDLSLAQIRQNRKKRPAVESDSDDNLTLADVMLKKSSQAAGGGGRSKRKDEGEERRKRPKTTAPAAPVVDKPSSGPPTKKHALVEQILRRWHYCLPPWPSPDIDTTPPKGFIACGFRGLFVDMRDLTLGETLDKRDKLSGRPPVLRVLLDVDTAELRDILVNGLEAQKLDLLAHQEDEAETSFAATLSDLEKELAVARRLKERKVEKEFGQWKSKRVKK